MKLPELPILLGFIGLLWCAAGVAAHGWVMLAYPLMWLAVGLFFLALNAIYDSLNPEASPEAFGATAPAAKGSKEVVRNSDKKTHQTV